MTQALDPPLQMWPVDASNPQSTIGSDWLRWFQRVYSTVNTQSSQIGSVHSVKAQSGAITGGTLTGPALTNGPTRINYYLEKTLADGLGSSVTVTLGWTHNAKPLLRSFPPLTDDSIYATSSASIPVMVDQNSAITYSVDYISATGLTQYSLDVWVNQP